MLNYVWAILIIIGIGAALFTDISKEFFEESDNGKFKIELIKESTEPENTKAKLFYSGDTLIFSANIIYSENQIIESIILFSKNQFSGELKNIAENFDDSDKIECSVTEIENDNLYLVHFKTDKFVNLKNVTNTTLEYAGIAVEISIGLIGIMALWLGIMKIAEEAGLVKIIAKVVRPITKRLFPDVPSDHPAIASIVMNMSANMLGLGNAATPFGLKAMEELNKINPDKTTASNAMCTFLAINTAGLTLIPATAIAVRAAAGSSNPAIIIGTSFFGALCATIAGISAAKLFEKFSGSDKSFFNLRTLLVFASIIITGILIVITSGDIISKTFSSLDFTILKDVIEFVSIIAIPFIIFSFILIGIIKKINIYESFVEGAKEGFNVAVRIIPFLVAMLVAIGIFRAGGGMEWLVSGLSWLTESIGMPSEALPMAVMRPLSGSGSLGIMTEIINQHGPDSFIGVLTSTFFGSTETTFYVLAVYFGSVNIKKTRHAMPAGLIADIAGILGALFIVKLIMG